MASHNSKKNEISSEVSDSIKNSSIEYNLKNTINPIENIFKNLLINDIPAITWKNLFKTIKVIFAVLITITYGTLSSVGSIGDFIIRLIREMSIFMHAVSPVIIQLIDFFAKIIGGFFIIIAGVINRTKTYNAPNQNREITYNNFLKRLNSQVPAVDWKTRNRILKEELQTHLKM